jgi:hypothetical protein
MKKLNVAIIGAKFMGKAHSSSWSRVHRFFDFTAETWKTRGRKRNRCHCLRRASLGMVNLRTLAPLKISIGNAQAPGASTD